MTIYEEAVRSTLRAQTRLSMVDVNIRKLVCSLLEENHTGFSLALKEIAEGFQEMKASIGVCEKAFMHHARTKQANWVTRLTQRHADLFRSHPSLLAFSQRCLGLGDAVSLSLPSPATIFPGDHHATWVLCIAEAFAVELDIAKDVIGQRDAHGQRLTGIRVLGYYTHNSLVQFDGPISEQKAQSQLSALGQHIQAAYKYFLVVSEAHAIDILLVFLESHKDLYGAACAVCGEHVLSLKEAIHETSLLPIYRDFTCKHFPAVHHACWRKCVSLPNINFALNE